MILSVKKVFAMSIVVSLLGVIATWGLKTLTSEEIIGPVEAYTTYGPIKLTMRLNKNAFRLGEKVNATVTITNISNETILSNYLSPPAVDLVVFNSSMEIIYTFSKTHGFITIVGAAVPLEPSASHSQTLEWEQLEVDDFPSFTSRQVQPGTYYIAGQTGPNLYYLEPEDGDYEFKGYITIETPKIEIQVL